MDIQDDRVYALISKVELDEMIRMVTAIYKHIHKEEKVQDNLDTPLIATNLSARTKNCLSWVDVNTIGDVLKYEPQRYLNLRNFGKGSLKELVDFMHKQGLWLEY